MKNIKVVFVAAVLAAGITTLRADIFDLGTSSTPIPMDISSRVTGSNPLGYDLASGGSLDTSTLNGTTLPWVYCLSLLQNINPSGNPFDNTGVTTTGVVNGQTVNNVGKVAWLLGNYATGGDGDAQGALQAAIWHVIYDGSSGVGGVTASLDTTSAGHADATMILDYNNDLTALGNNTSSASAFLWLSPGHVGSTDTYQPLVTVPEPTTMIAGALLLLPFGASTVRILRRKRIA